jgi:hypothetical protein
MREQLFNLFRFPALAVVKKLQGLVRLETWSVVHANAQCKESNKIDNVFHIHYKDFHPTPDFLSGTIK